MKERSIPVSVDVYLVQEGNRPNPTGMPYFQVPVSDAASQLGLSRGLPYWTPDQPPRFGEASAIDGVREPRYVVVEIGKAASESLGFPEGFYLLKKTVAEIRTLKAQMEA
jgi:hypothetical protein